MNEALSPAPAIDCAMAATLMEPLTNLVVRAGAAILAVNRAAMRIDGKLDGSPVTEADLAVAAARHHDQLNLYRRVVGILTGLSGSAVAAELVFTRIGRRVAMPPAGG